MKKYSKEAKGFILGVLVMVVMAAFIVPVVAQSAERRTVRTIIDQGEINIYLNGSRHIPVDSAGNVIEPFLHAGTTFMPVRAMVEMLTDLSVYWDSDARSVHIGTRPVAPSTPMHELNMFQINQSGFYTGREAQFDTVNGTVSPFNRLRNRTDHSGSRSRPFTG